MKIPLSIFGAFRPTDWREEAYTKNPPFTVENMSGRVFILPRDREVESALDMISPSLGLKKVRQGHVSYLASRGDAVKGLREFDWYIRRSWRNEEFSVLWAIAYLGESEGWKERDFDLQVVSEVAGLTAEKSQATMQKLFSFGGNGGSTFSPSDPMLDKTVVQQSLEKIVSGLPIWTEEMLMSVLCAGPGGSVAEIYEAVLVQGLSIGAVYKLAERLKTRGYVYPIRHYRVNERGPMREMLTADCRNCYFGYSNPDSCLLDTLRQIEDVLERDYGKKPTGEERRAVYASVKAVPYASRTNRRVLTSLRLMHELDRMSKEGRIASMLKKIEQGYGVELPLKIPQDSVQ